MKRQLEKKNTYSIVIYKICFRPNFWKYDQYKLVF